MLEKHYFIGTMKFCFSDNNVTCSCNHAQVSSRGSFAAEVVVPFVTPRGDVIESRPLTDDGGLMTVPSSRANLKSDVAPRLQDVQHVRLIDIVNDNVKLSDDNLIFRIIESKFENANYF